MKSVAQDIPLETIFVKDENPNKFALFWASGIYKRINYNLRNVSFSEQFKATPNTFWFTKNYIAYFKKYGYTAKQLIEKSINHLYRGIRNTNYFQVKPGQTYNDTGFIATSYDLSVAKDIAEQDFVIEFDVLSLPNEIPFIIIDDRIAEYLLESEVLIMPGTIQLIENKTGNTLAKYVPNLKLIDAYLRSKDPEIVMSGGALTIPKIDIEDKTLVFYRAIYNRPVEVLKVMYFPKNPSKEILRAIRKTENFFESMTEMIPEFMDLQKYLKSKNITEEEFKITFAKMNSYIVHIALWSSYTRKVETIHLFELPILFKENFDVSRSDDVENQLNKLLDENMK